MNNEPDERRLVKNVSRHPRWETIGVCFFLIVITWLVFGQTLRHGFCNYDDDVYVYENPLVLGGLTMQNVEWAFSHFHSSNWHPLTWCSHMLDCELYGTNPAGHHLTNLLWHAATAILLFLTLRRMTGAVWRSALVAAIFAIHPLRVESVAWVAERKDVLSGFFFMLTLWVYVWQARQPWSAWRYGLVVGAFAMGLMAKPMLVTLPCVLVLMDFWPLRRMTSAAGEPIWKLFGREIPRRLVIEKMPLLVLAAISCLITWHAQDKAFSTLPPGQRAGNALVSYVTYLGQMFYPVKLAVFYPHPENGLAAWEIVATAVLLLAISAVTVTMARQRPWFLIGWLWYLGMLVPAIGIIQVGAQAHADRYTYLPQIGILVMLVWAAAEAARRLRLPRSVASGCAGFVIATLMLLAHRQVAFWQDSETLWAHTLACTEKNIVAHNNLGNALCQKGDLNGAITQYQEALKIMPDHAEAHYNLANVLMRQGKTAEAITHYRAALESKPDDPKICYNLGVALLHENDLPGASAQFHHALQINPDDVVVMNNYANTLLQQGQVDAAITWFQKAVALRPDRVEAHYNLGQALLQKGSLNEAVDQFQTVVKLRPGDAEVHYLLGSLLLKKNDVGEAVGEFQAVLRIKPDHANALNDLAWTLATTSQVSLRDGNQAVALAQRANQLTGGTDPDLLDTLAAAYAEAGRFTEARQSATKAIELAQAGGHQDQVTQLNSELKLYEAGQPFHQQ